MTHFGGKNIYVLAGQARKKHPMFYSKYRPQKFSELVNSDNIVSTLTGALAKGKPAHAYFFTGSRGIGKTTTARLLAKALNCENPITGEALAALNEQDYIKFEPCGKCKSCKAIQAGNHLDLIEIDAASNRGIDNIRDLRDKVKLSPTMSKNKVYIIDEVHMLTTEASNAILKTLEEPASHAYFILCTTNPEKVLDTIKSRCSKFQFNRPSIDDIVQKLRLIATDQKYDVSDEKLKRIAVISKGAFRDAETLLEQLVNGDSEVEKLLSEQESNYFEFVSLIFSGNKADGIKFVHEVYKEGVSLESWTEKLIQYLRSMILQKVNVVGIDDTFELNEIEKQLVSEVTLQNLKSAVQIFNDSISGFQDAVIPTLPLELAVIEVSQLFEEMRGAPANEPLPTKPSDEKNTKPADESMKNLASETKSKTKPQNPNTNLEFPYAQLIEKVMPQNHSIHVILRSCKVTSFDGKTLGLLAFYSFHKERLMSRKIRDIVEDAASELVGTRTIINCILSDEKPNAHQLTDKNIISSSNKADVVEVFEKIFEDELESD